MRIFVLGVLLLFFTFNAFGASISGFITDNRNGESVPDAAVFIKGLNNGAYSNNKGYYIITSVPTGKYELIIRNGVYKPQLIEVAVGMDTEQVLLNVELEYNIIEAEVIEIVGEEFGINTSDIKSATVHFKTSDIQAVSQIGEADVFRSLQSLPGVTPISDFSSGLYIRGGSPDQNLILLDGIDVYNPNHFGGIFSTFNSDAVKKLELIKCGYPAKYGGRLSSVLDVTNKDGNRKNMQGVLRTSLIATSATIESPWSIGGEKGSIMGSYRRTYIDLIKNALDLEMPDYYFYDGHAKVNWDISNRDKVSFSTYFGKDNLTIKEADDFLLYWGNDTFSAQWMHIFNPNLFSQFIVAGSRFFSYFGFESDADEKFERKNDLTDLTVKGSLTYKPVEDHIIDFGFDFKRNNIDFTAKTNGDESDARLPNVEVSSNLLSLYTQDTWDIDALWTLEPGIRVAFCQATSEYLANKPVTSYTRVSPRFSARYKTSVHSSIYATYGRYYQFLTLIADNEEGGSPFDLWFPLDKTIEPGESNHYLLGFNTELPGEMSLETEVYYKDYKNLTALNENADQEWNNETGTLSDALHTGTGYSYGGEILLRTNWAGFEGFVGYTYSLTKRKIKRVNLNPNTGEEMMFYPKYDRSNQINIVETYNISDNLDFFPLGADCRIGITYSFGTGQPYDLPEIVFNENGNKFRYGDSYLDRQRLPYYSRLDLSLKMKWQFETWSIEPYLQVINVTKRENTWYRDYNGWVENNIWIIRIDEESMFPQIPFIGVDVKF